MELRDRYEITRKRSVAICGPLALEDYVPQPTVDVSPPKWHLGHTSWFFETLVLMAHHTGYRQFHPQYGHLFNSYYESQGSRVLRHKRGDLSRPTVSEILAYRDHVDNAMRVLLQASSHSDWLSLVELGLQHEQQHQELLLTDIKYILAVNPLQPAYLEQPNSTINVTGEFKADVTAPEWLLSPGGLIEVGAASNGFAFDNERPRHRVWLEPYEMRSTLVTNREYVTFIENGGYSNAQHWFAEGWDWVKQGNEAPLYWVNVDGKWQQFTLQGLKPVELDAPVTHVNWYEAAAYCKWAGLRLPKECEWENSASQFDWGRRWEWTQDSYSPYPGFRPFGGVASEYNGKFMVNQMVLRGASFATPPGHSRISYRNFFYPQLRWQYTGIRPARDAVK